MLRSKYFWIAVVVLVPFIVVWVMYSLAWAVGMLITIGVLFLFVLGGRRSRRTRIYRVCEDDYDEDDDDEDIIIVDRRLRSSSSSGRMRELYIPKVDKDFYVPSGLRKRQEEDLKRTMRRLRR